MSIFLPKPIKYCISTLENHGFECYCVGGAVRDSLMGINPTDYDITTNAMPQEIIGLFSKTIPTGIKQGTVTVIIDDFNIEVTTYRNDGNYSNNRSPDNVSFVSNIENDLSRRDFTINAICYNPKNGIYDPLNGCLDIKNKIIKAIGNPDIRFSEDALRIIRAFRFSSQLNFSIENNTKTSALKNSDLLKNISVERIYIELKKAFLSENPQNFSPLMLSSALNFLGIPEIEIPTEIKNAPKNFALRFAIFCKNANINTENVLKELKCDNKTIIASTNFQYMLNLKYDFNRYSIKKLLNLFDLESVLTFFKYVNNQKYLDELTDILRKNEVYNLSMLNIDGNDLIDIGIEGKNIGLMLNKLLDTCIMHPEYNNKEKLKELLKNI